MQRGTIVQKGNSWILIFRQNGKQTSKKLADVDARFPRKRDVESAKFADKYLDPANAAVTTPSGTQLLTTFIEHVYFKKANIRPSTKYGYENIFETHLKNRLKNVRVMDFTPGFGQRLLDQIASEEGHLSKNSLRNVRGFLKGVFTFAQTEDCFTAINPMGPVKVPKGNPNHKKNVYAYSLEEVAKILDALEGVEPARTVIAVAIFTGLRKGEINGLKWGDLKDNVINVNRTVWMSNVQDFTKTEASKAGVPVLPVLAEILEQHRNGFKDDRFMFEGAKLHRPLDFHNLVNRVIKPTLKKAKVEWHGLHSFRRGIATNLHHLGMPDKEIQAVLRHANIKTTQDIYIQPVTPDVQRGLAKLGKAFAKMSRKK